MRTTYYNMAQELPNPGMPIVFFDIETLPTCDPAEVQAVIEAIKPPGIMRKAETIAQWKKDERPLLVYDAVHKTGFNADLGSICTIAWALGNGPVVSAQGNDEAAVLEEFLAAVDMYAQLPLHDDRTASRPLAAGGHVIHWFDLPFVRKRAIINRVPLTDALPWKEPRYSPRIQDTALLWDADPKRHTKLDTLCRILGVESSKALGMDGSMVWDFWTSGEHDKVAGYCREDVRAARECWHILRM